MAEEMNPRERVPCTYLLRCADGSLYCGWTNDLPRRLKAHRSGKGGKYTRSRLPVELAWTEVQPSPTKARQREAQIKKMPKEYKEALVRAYAAGAGSTVKEP